MNIPHNGFRGTFLGIKRLERVVDHGTSSTGTAEVHVNRVMPLFPHCVSYGILRGEIFTFTYHKLEKNVVLNFLHMLQNIFT